MDDVSSAFDTILHKGQPFEIYNIGETLLPPSP